MEERRQRKGGDYYQPAIFERAALSRSGVWIHGSLGSEERGIIVIVLGIKLISCSSAYSSVWN